MSEATRASGTRPLGRIDGRYTIVSRLGKGSMGVVYRAHDDQIGRDVAVKVMVADAEGDEIAVERFRREARAMGRLLHRNVVTVYNMGESTGRHYIVMELLEGCTLSEWVKAGSHPLEEKVDLMLQACDGLAVAHSAGIIHRDVKPNNLFVQADGTMKIVDFGIARLASSNMTRSGLVLGTPHYMAPEQARGAEVDGRSDIFSAAAVFYHMLTGRKPFDGNDLPIVLHRVAHDDPQPLSDVEAPTALARIISKGLRKAPDQRYQSVAEFAADLARFKRQFDGDTRRLVTFTEQRVDDLRRAAAELETLRTSLGLPGPSPLIAALANLTAQFPVLDQTGPGKASRTTPDCRDGALALEAAVNDVARVADEDRTRLSALQEAIAAGERALAADDPQQALECLRGGVPWLQGAACPALQTLVARAQKLLAEQIARTDYVKAVLDQGRQAEASGQWSVAAQCANDALSLSAASAEARALLARANHALTEAAAAKAQRARRLHEQAEASVTAGRFDQADHLISLIAEIDAADAGLPALQARLVTAREAEAKRSADVRAAAELLASTRASFAAGQRDHAIATLDAFVRMHPTLPAVADQLRKFRDQAAQIAAQEARATEAQALVDQAEGAWRRGDVDGCERLAARALALTPDLAPATELQQRVHSKRTELELGRARGEQAATLARSAVVALARGSYDLAESEARRALALDPERGDAAVVLAEVPGLVLETRLDAERRRADIERARAVDQLVRDAQSLLSGGDYQRAAATAEQASELDSTRAGVAPVLAQCRSVLAAAQAGGWDGADRRQGARPPAEADNRRPSVRQLADGARAWFSGTLRSKR